MKRKTKLLDESWMFLTGLVFISTCPFFCSSFEVKLKCFKYYEVSLSSLPNSDDLSKVKLIVIHLGDEDGCHGLVERRAVHVDGRSDGQHETDDASVDVVVLKEALEGDRQSSRATTGKEI